jgi:hypothetical protein
VSHQLGDDDDVDAVAQELGSEGMAQGVGMDPGLAGVGVAGLVDEAGGHGEFGDDVAESAHARSFTAPGQEQRAGVVGAAMSRSDVQPGPQRDTGGVVQRDLASPSAVHLLRRQAAHRRGDRGSAVCAHPLRRASLAVLLAKAPAKLETVNDLDGDLIYLDMSSRRDVAVDASSRPDLICRDIRLVTVASGIAR